MLTSSPLAYCRQIWATLSRTATHLLRDHDHEGSQCCAAHTSDSEQLYEPCNISSLACEVLLPVHFLDVSVSQHYFLKSYLGVDIIEVACCLKWRITETTEGVERVLVSMLLDVPSRRFYHTLAVNFNLLRWTHQGTCIFQLSVGRLGGMQIQVADATQLHQLDKLLDLQRSPFARKH